LRVVEPTEGFRDMLSDILVVNLTLISVRQNDQTKKISAWAAILIVPTLIAGIYGMNFDFMPELHWAFGYPFALGLMVSLCLGLYAVFRRIKWLYSIAVVSAVDPLLRPSASRVDGLRSGVRLRYCPALDIKMAQYHCTPL
jgi:hypothetical protein